VTYSTLSPIPGFWPRYLRPILEGRGDGYSMDRETVVSMIPAKAQKAISDRLRELGGDADDEATVLVEILSRPGWIEDSIFVRHLRKPLVDVAYTYIAEETDSRGKPLNPVAGFHLGNGASISRSNVNFAANTSSRGLSESCSLMVNYVYSQTALTPIGRAVRSLLPWVRRGRPART
jgi:hypothetical protein